MFEWENILMNIGQRGILNSGGVLVAEHSSSLSLEKKYGELEMLDQRKYGDSLVSFFEVCNG